MRLEDHQRFVLVDEETGRIEYGDFISIVGAIMRIFGRPPTHLHPVEQWPLEEDEVDHLYADTPGYAIGRIEWEQKPLRYGEPNVNETDEARST